ncbi:flagellar biosynthesis anti-sigma factor FlgM [Parendozoicomonas haliclonae]|nr:flagellar biosynthesis anti-sigma factor FlgM [Parendozoicomonas haliclonae]
MSESDRIKARSGSTPIARKSSVGSAAKVSSGVSSGKATSTSSQQTSIDKVELSTGAQLLEALGSEVEALQDIDLARVEEVKEAIRNGRMPVDHEQLANRMQAFFKQLAEDSGRS